MLLDMHTHLWVQDGSRDTAEENKRTILKTCENFQVDRIYLSSLGSYYPDEEEIRCLNRMTYDFMREYPELVRGYCYFIRRMGSGNSNRWGRTWKTWRTGTLNPS